MAGHVQIRQEVSFADFTEVPDTILQQVQYFSPFPKFPRETMHCNVFAVPIGKAMSKVRSASGLILAYLAMLNLLADLNKMIKSQKKYCSDSDF